MVFFNTKKPAFKPKGLRFGLLMCRDNASSLLDNAPYFKTFDFSHWRPMYLLCSFCSRHYDYILRYENLTLETQQFLKYKKWDTIIPPTVSTSHL